MNTNESKEMNDFPESVKENFTEEQIKNLLIIHENQANFILDESNEKKDVTPFDKIKWPHTHIKIK